MKNGLLTFLIMLFVLPAFSPWMPHGVIHALHDQHVSHHKSDTSGHNHHHDHSHSHSHSHNEHGHETVQNQVHFDVVTYFSDYLHVDLKQPNNTTLKVPSFDSVAFDFVIPQDIFAESFHLASVQNRGPPPDISQHKTRTPSTPLYLSTQRLRI